MRGLHPHVGRRRAHMLARARPLLLLEGLALLPHHLRSLRLLQRLPSRRLAPPPRELARLSRAQAWAWAQAQAQAWAQAQEQEQA